jgi:hypothetical protein
MDQRNLVGRALLANAVFHGWTATRLAAHRDKSRSRLKRLGARGSPPDERSGSSSDCGRLPFDAMSSRAGADRARARYRVGNGLPIGRSSVVTNRSACRHVSESATRWPIRTTEAALPLMDACA